ncbi:MAG: hypothetical protein HWE33_12340 [Rhodobacteraceae bacterium]|nr:hypothetical protein [Paracoccaceae bacterium]
MDATDTPTEFYISPSYKRSDWSNLNISCDLEPTAKWNTATAILKDRLCGRFLNPAQTLIDNDPESPGRASSGFAIMALCFLVAETIQGFREGVTNHTRKSTGLCINFFKQWSAFGECLSEDQGVEELAKKLYQNGRCALLHSAATDELLIGRQGPMISFETGGIIRVNRTIFHQKLLEELDSYLDLLKAPDQNNLRQNFITKMNYICGVVPEQAAQ